MSILLEDHFDNDSGFWTIKMPPESWSLEAGKYKVVVPDTPDASAVSSAGDARQDYTFDNDLQGWMPDLGTWQIVASGILEGTGSGQDSLRNNITISNNYTNYNVSLKFQYVSGSNFESNNFGFFTRYKDENNCLLVFLSRFPTPKIGFLKIESGSFTLLKDESIPEYDMLPHTLDITDNGSKITVKLDGTTYLDNIAYDTTIDPGKKGIAVNNDLTYRIDDIIIKNLEWADYMVEAKVRLASGNGAGLIVKTNNDFSNGLIFMISQGDGLVVGKALNHEGSLVYSSSLADLYAEYSLKIKAGTTNTSLEFYVKGGEEYPEETLLPVPVDQITEPELLDVGNVGFIAFQNSTAYFDDVVVTKTEQWIHAIADFNGDGYINIQDFSLWRLKYGKKLGDTGWDPIYDLDNDGFVAMPDFSLWRTHYGQKDPRIP